jgi:hypothetical protein
MIASPGSREPPALARKAAHEAGTLAPGPDEPVTAARGKQHGKKKAT